METRLNNMISKSQKTEGPPEKYEFKSLLRQKYFNERFKERQLPASMLKQECRRGVLNFLLMSEFLAKPEDAIGYCEEITAKYLLKYFPYQCFCCQRLASHMLIAKCSSKEEESCDHQICLQCALELYQFLEQSQ